jgi:DNA-binding transcriptional MerR regulator
MSSSKSIAAARNRRANEQPNINPSRPITNTNTSSNNIISSNVSNTNIDTSSMKAGSTNRSIPVVVPPGKLSISDAFSLLTLRLSRVEQHLQHLEENNNVIQQHSAPIQNIDIPLSEIKKRLDLLEEKFSAINNLSNTKMENEIKVMKDLLITHMAKYEKKDMEIEKKMLENDIKYENLLLAFQEWKNIISDTNSISENNILSNDIKKAIQSELLLNN